LICESGRLGSEVQVRPCQRLRQAALLPERHIVLPIEARGENFGMVNLHCRVDRQLSPDDLDLLQAISAQLSEVVANAWLRQKLAEKELARQALLESLVEAQEEERGRLARELHDGAGQMLTNLLVRLKTLEKRSETPRCARASTRCSAPCPKPSSRCASSPTGSGRPRWRSLAWPWPWKRSSTRWRSRPAWRRAATYDWTNRPWRRAWTSPSTASPRKR
jgi:hypothetical protein